jgi:hypothetical protein
MLKFLIAGAFLAAASASAAAEPAETSEKMVCKRIKESTGWRLSASSKVCKKKKEWDAESRDAQRDARDETRGDK